MQEKHIKKSYQVLLEDISAKTESIKRTLEIKKIEIYWTEKLNKAEKQRLEDIRNIEIEKQQVLAEKQKELEDAQGKIVNLTDAINQNQLTIQELQNEIDKLKSNRLTAKRI